MKKRMKKFLSFAASCAIILSATSSVIAADDENSKVTIAPANSEGVIYVFNEGGQTLSYHKDSGVDLVYDGGYAFKDLNRNGALDVYEDWRKTTKERATDLASQMVADENNVDLEGIKAIAGLMLYSSHQKIPGGAAYSGTDSYPDPDNYNDYDLTVGQMNFLKNDDLRHVLITSVSDPDVAAKWSNKVQAFVEGIKWGIPANNSSDPRHGADNSAEFNAGAGGTISQWPDSLGMAATMDASLELQFASIASTEYRALGISTALSPQVDMATDPRWYRMSGTFGEDSLLSTDFAKAYVDGFQTTSSTGGWGLDSVNAMVKHWPGGGAGEGGRDAHFGFGKFAVYPGNNFDEHLLPFTQGAFNLDGGTEKASAVMPYYTISLNQDTKYNENVGNGYSRYIITDLLRGTYEYEGVVCTDWGIVSDYVGDNTFGSTPWGVESLTKVEKFEKVLLAGTDQFGGVNTSENIIAVYQKWVNDDSVGKAFADNRFKESAIRLLTNIFNAGLFEDPYLDPAISAKVVGNADYMEAGFNAQLKSIVMVKNAGNTIAASTGTKQKVYVPQQYIGETINYWGQTIEGYWKEPVEASTLSKYYDIVSTPEEADVAIVFMTQPDSGRGYDPADLQEGGNGYFPISLQYRPYTATAAREYSIGASPGTKNTDGTIVDNVENRSYKGKSVTSSNEAQLDTLIATKKAMGNKPVIASMSLKNPVVMAEIDPYADAIVVDFGVQAQAVLEIVSGKVEPSGLLPLQMPINMDTVEKQYEDVSHDMECYVDVAGNTYDFAYGLNYSGVIEDERTDRYKKTTENPEKPAESSKPENPKTSDVNVAATAVMLILTMSALVIIARKKRSK